MTKNKQIGIVGTKGVIDIEDTHRDLVMATEVAQGPAYNPNDFKIDVNRNVDFLNSFPPGDMYNGELWGPMKEETNSWLQRIYLNKETPHATAKEGHRNLLLTMAMDLSAKLEKEIKLPIKETKLMEELTSK